MTTNKASACNVGMMGAAFFVGRTELISWVNGLLETSITKVEQCASGSIYCQILDSCHPGTVSMKKVNWMARSDHEFIPNYKVLQAAFDKNGIKRHVAVDQLIRAKYQDNLEFLQFMKHYWEHAGSRKEYDPRHARGGKQLPPWAASVGNQIGGGAAEARGPRNEKENVPPRAEAAPAKSAAEKRVSAARAPAAATATAAGPAGGAAARGGVLPTPPGEAAALKTKVAVQAEEIEDLKNALDCFENERDFYFRKLREVEVLCSTLQAQLEGGAALETVTPLLVVTGVQEILYAENDGDELASEAEAKAEAEATAASA